MEINFQNIQSQIVSIEDFCLQSRFELSDFQQIPSVHRNQIYPLNSQATKFISNFIERTNLHKDVPFQKGLFRAIDKAKILADNNKEISKWLYKRGLAFDQRIFLYIDEYQAIVLTWKIFIKYFEIFNSYNDDISVFDETLQWAILVYHEYEIYFGTKKDFIPNDDFSEYFFSW